MREEDLQDLGINILGLKGKVIDSTLYNNRNDITEAAHELLKKWFKGNIIKTFTNTNVVLFFATRVYYFNIVGLFFNLPANSTEHCDALQDHTVFELIYFFS